jgi:hypothetical protein
VLAVRLPVKKNMSYTPEAERLTQPLEKVADALEELTSPIRARLKNHNDYKDEHLAEMSNLLNEVTAMESRIRYLLSRVS